MDQITYDDGTCVCARCGEEVQETNFEAFALIGEIICDECAAGVFEENSQFGMGA